MDTEQPPLFRVLVTQKGWHDYEVFKRRYQQAAAELSALEGPESIATAPPPEKRQFIRWLQGEVKTAPRTEARRILQFLFPGTDISRLFALVENSAKLADSDVASSAAEKDQSVSSGPHVEDAVAGAAFESAQFVNWAEVSNVGPYTMEQLEADIRRVVSTYPNRPVGPLFREARDLRNNVFRILEGRQPPRFTRDLYLAAGVLCGVLANASFDLGRYSAAETQARSAFMCGEIASHNGLRAWVRGLQALIAYWDGRPHEAVQLAATGLEFTPEDGTAHIRLASIQARAYGQLQLTSDAIAAMDRADSMRGDLPLRESILGGMMDFPLEKQLFYASSTHLWLGGDDNLRDAERRAVQAVELYETAAPEERRLGEMSLARMDLGMACLGRGDIEGATDQVYEVLSVDARRRTESVRKRLGQFARHLALHPAASTAPAIAVREAIVVHQEGPAELPPGGTS